jgi:hypothetical protein
MGLAGPSTTTVDFGQCEMFADPLPAPMQDIPLRVAILPSCFDPGCEFTVTVDTGNVLADRPISSRVCPGS